MAAASPPAAVPCDTPSGPLLPVHGQVPELGIGMLWLRARRPESVEQIGSILGEEGGTDAASEGIDLHERCHRLIKCDIPLKP